MNRRLHNFDVLMPSRILFGRGKSKQAPDLVKNFGSRGLVVHGSNKNRTQWFIDIINNTLNGSNADMLTLSTASEPQLHDLEEQLEIAKLFKPDFVISIGGGSVIDFGKALAALIPAKYSALAYLEVVGEGKKLETNPLPFIAVPTTSGTGAEATKNAVISVPKFQRKVSLRDEKMIADLVIVDPELTDHCPSRVTLASGLDAITQLIEPYISIKANTLTDSLCINALPKALKAIKILSEYDDQQARDDMAWASLCSGIALANAGLGVVHGFAGVIGGLTQAPHGEICASLLGASLKINKLEMQKQNMDLSHIEEIETLIGEAFCVPKEEAFLRLDEFIKSSKLRSLKNLGVEKTDYEKISLDALTASSMRTNPVELNKHQLFKILEHSAIW